jgi:hypothetical protein
MTVLPLSLFMFRIVVFFLPLTVVVFQRKRSESLNGLLLRIDLRRGTLRCQARPDLWGLEWMQLRLDKHELLELLSKNPCMWLGSVPCLKASSSSWRMKLFISKSAIWCHLISAHLIADLYLKSDVLKSAMSTRPQKIGRTNSRLDRASVLARILYYSAQYFRR